MTLKAKGQLYDQIYANNPEEFFEIKELVGSDIDYEFIEPYYIKNSEYNCIDYSKIISKVKWPDEKMRGKIEKADFSITEEAVPFLIAGTVIKTEKKEEGKHIIYFSDDEYLWNNPDDYDRLLHIKNTLAVQHCIVAHELLPERKEYSIGSIESIHPGTRVMFTAFMLVAPTQNENWLLVCFSDIKPCSANVSRMRKYYDVFLDIEYRMITREEYYDRFLFHARLKGVLKQSDDIKNSDSQEGGCYIATCVYGSYDCPEVWTLRRYRDFNLLNTWYGRIFVDAYYIISPKLVKWFGNSSWFKLMWRGVLDKMVKCLKEKGVESTPYKDNK